MKKIKSVGVVVLIGIMILCMTACAAKNLEDYMAKNDGVSSDIKSQISQLSNKTMDVSYGVEKNCLTFNFNYKNTMESDQVEYVGKAFEKSEDTFQDMANEIISNLEDETGLSDITVKFVYTNGDGKEIWNKEFNND